MASESHDPTLRKHRRSPSDEEMDSVEPSKRRKHRHHHRHNRHHHGHHNRSKKQDKVEDATKIKVEANEKRPEEGNCNDSDRNDAVEVSPAAVAFGTTVSGLSLGIDYDMEEGEIIEEDENGVAVGGGDGKKKESNSDMESGEIEEDSSGVRPCPRDLDNFNMGIEASLEEKKADSCLPLQDIMGDDCKNSGIAGKDKSDRKESRSCEAKKHNDVDLERQSNAEHVTNGNVTHDYPRDHFLIEEPGKRYNNYDDECDLRDQRDHFLIEEPGKRYNNYDDECDLRDQRKFFVFESEEMRHRDLSSSPSGHRHHEEVRNHGMSHDKSRGRSRFQSNLRELSETDMPNEQDNT